MEALKALVSTFIVVLNLVSKGLSFYCATIFTGLLRHKPFIAPLIDSSIHPEVFLKVSKDQYRYT